MIRAASIIKPASGVYTQPTPAQQQQASDWFADLRDLLTAAFEAIEADYAAEKDGIPCTFTRTDWHRPPGPNGEATGGGTMALMRGAVFEKVGVNISCVHGEFAPEFRGQIPGTEESARFWASGISLVAHMANPHVPAVHMNTRHVVTSRGWFGGGADLTPCLPNPAHAARFHAELKKACDAHGKDYYARYKPWCDEYFHLKHRNEPRGIGGIFYDYHDSGNWQADFAFTQDVGRALLTIFPQLVRETMHQPFTAADKQAQQQKRARYVEFNLLYDRGTKFGLMTGGNTDAILMSLPPDATW